MKKYAIDMEVVENVRLHRSYSLLKLTAGRRLPASVPGQFVQVRVDGSPSTFLRRPISIHFVDKPSNELWLLIRLAGAGTRRMAEYRRGERLNVLLPLGNGFSVPPASVHARLLLIGGGVGAAPMLYLGDTLKNIGFKPEFLLGARSKDDLVQLPLFEQIGTTHLTTEDGSTGEKGFVTDHSVLNRQSPPDRIYTCGPEAMMQAVARYAETRDVDCEASLENRMACGIGACLCCVEKTVKGNVCSCTEGPVFNIRQLTWPI